MGIRKILFLVFLMNCSLCASQNDEVFVNSQVAQIMAQLEMQETPEYFSRKEYCLDNTQIFVLPDGSRCAPTSTYYSVCVFWKEDDKLKLQKFDNCGSFMPITLENEKLLKKIPNMKEVLKKEDLAPYNIEAKNERPTANMGVQPCQKEYVFKLQGETFQKIIVENDSVNDSKNKRDNNKKSLSLINLDKEIGKLISELEIKGRFFREK